MIRKKQYAVRKEEVEKAVAALEELRPIASEVTLGLVLRLQSVRRKLPHFIHQGGGRIGRIDRLSRERKLQAIKLARCAVKVYFLAMQLDPGFFSPN